MVNPIRAHRKQLDMTLAQLAAACGMSGGLLGVWERGEAVPAQPRLQAIAQLLGEDESKLRAELEEFRGQVGRLASKKLQETLA